jgi:hypothetical protein
MSRISCRTAFGLSSSPMRSEFRRNLSRSSKRTGSFTLSMARLRSGSRRPQLSGVGLGLRRCRDPGPLVVHSLTALALARGYQATPLCRDRRGRSPVTFGCPVSADRADAR